MKIHEYNEMMAYLTRPAMAYGGRIGFDAGGDAFRLKKLNEAYAKFGKDKLDEAAKVLGFKDYASMGGKENENFRRKIFKELTEFGSVLPDKESRSRSWVKKRNPIDQRIQIKLLEETNKQKFFDAKKFAEANKISMKELKAEAVKLRNNIYDKRMLVAGKEMRSTLPWIPDDLQAADNALTKMWKSKLIVDDRGKIENLFYDAFKNGSISSKKYLAIRDNLTEYYQLRDAIKAKYPNINLALDHPLSKSSLKNLFNASADQLIRVNPLEFDLNNGFKDSLSRQYELSVKNKNLNQKKAVEKIARDLKLNIGKISDDATNFKYGVKEFQKLNMREELIKSLKNQKDLSDNFKTYVKNNPELFKTANVKTNTKITKVTSSQINNIGKMLLEGADKSTIMKIRKVLGCMSEGGRVGLAAGSGNLLECPMKKFAENPEAVLNKVGAAMPETRTPIMNALTKIGVKGLQWAGKGFIAATPIFAGMEIADAVEKYEKGVPSGQIAMDVVGNWVIPGAGGAYKNIQKNIMLDEVARPDELSALDKYRKYSSAQEMAKGAIEFGEEEAAQKLMDENQLNKEEQLKLFKLMEKQKAAEYWNQQRRKGERAKVAEESTDTFSNLEDWSAAEGGRAGFDKGSKPKDPSRRAFIKGITALAALPIVGKYFKLGKVLERAKTYTGPTIEKIKGMPEWFPGLVKKLWNEGEDVTKQVAYQERQIVKRGTLESGDDVDLIYDVGTGDVSINVTPKKGTHSTGSGAYNREYSLDYKKGIADESTRGTPPDEFGVAEGSPRQVGPEDVEIEFDDMINTDDALSDLTELEAFAKNKTTTQIHKKKGTKKKDVFPDYDPPDYDWDDFD